MSLKERVISYIPGRYIAAFAITLFEVLAIIGVMIALCMFVPYFYIAVGVTTFAVELKIIASDDNPDYKIPWMLFVLVIPVAGLMLYFIFGSRKLKKKYVNRLESLKNMSYQHDDLELLKKLEKENPIAANQAKILKTSLTQTYFQTQNKHIILVVKNIMKL